MSAKMQNFIVTGRIKKGTERGFSLEVSAKSERHAAALAKSMLGSRHRLRSTAFAIVEIKKR